MRSKAGHRNGFLHLIALPIRVLGKAKDFYVRSIINCSVKVSYSGSGQVSDLPKSFSVRSSKSTESDDFMELIRANSTRSLGSIGAEMDLYMLRQMSGQPPTAEVVPRSSTVKIMGRIDEDEPCEFGEDSVKMRSDLLYPRSRSCAVTKSSAVF
ncbi:uncharacterized protein LOC127808178 [Diospyros lotus]|uniref:uncharacterized protein LOC127808178 n=1 Tax=Diospyros lotus TaxID=55363 RepID=UPI0022522A11|nr:uncharacterized protein LOC127808178 [Diospyros lotus]